MYCKNCGREQKEGQKFCPNCGTPFLKLECIESVNHASNEEKDENSQIIDDFVIDKTNGTNTTDDKVNIETHNNTEVERTKNGIENVTIEDASRGIKKDRNSFAKKLACVLFVLCFSMYAFLFKPDFISSCSKEKDYSSSENSSFTEKEDYGPEWLTPWRFDSEPSNGVVTSIAFSRDGTVLSSAHDRYTGRRMAFNGSYYVKGNTIYVHLEGSSETIYFTIDNEHHHLISSSGYIFKPSI